MNAEVILLHSRLATQGLIVTANSSSLAFYCKFTNSKTVENYENWTSAETASRDQRYNQLKSATASGV